MNSYNEYQAGMEKKLKMSTSQVPRPLALSKLGEDQLVINWSDGH
jgi:hypothetical protein